MRRVDEINRRVAQSLRRLRRARGLTLEELSRRSGVSRAMLSQIESTKVNPTIAVMWRIAGGLGVPFAQLLGQEEPGPVTLVRRREARYLYSKDRSFRSRPLLTNVPGQNVELYEIWLAARAVHAADPHPEGSHELVAVLKGRLSLEVAGDQFDLGEGDAVWFAADRPHRYGNAAARAFLGHSLILYR